MYCTNSTFKVYLTSVPSKDDIKKGLSISIIFHSLVQLKKLELKRLLFDKIYLTDNSNS